ncbi:MAG: DUF4112 domain-containing protein [Prochloraceae cyanobacterium]|nr:DUF4112 domain-containing protein [Prochloraceae cyanobacterium]
MKNPKFKEQQFRDDGSTIKNLRSLSYLLDDAIAIPGTSYSIGIDPLLGLIPVGGDYLSAIFSAYIVIQSARMGASRATVSRMVFNIIVDTLVGTVPMLGDLFDFAWKANNKNIELLESALNAPEKTKKADWLFLILLLGALLLVVFLTASLSIYILSFLFRAIAGI